MSDRQDLLLAELCAKLASCETTRDLQSLIDIFNEHQLFSLKLSSLGDIVSHIHSCLNTSKNRIHGLLLLKALLDGCQTEVFLHHAPTWASLLLQCLQSPRERSACQSVACAATGVLLQTSTTFPELSRNLASSFIPGLVSALMEANALWLPASLKCLSQCMMHYGGPCGPLKGKIEKHLVECLKSNNPTDVTKAACEALPHLARCGGGGNFGAKHTEAWRQLVTKMIGSLHSTLDVLYHELETAEKSDPRPSATLSDISAKGLLSNQRLHHTLTHGLCAILSCEFPAVVELPLEQLLQLVCRSLALTPMYLMSRPTTERLSLAALLHHIHSDALIILLTLARCCGSLLLPHHRLVCRLLLQSLDQWNSPGGSTPYGHSRPYSSVRCGVYRCVCVWLGAVGSASGLEDHAQDLTEHILRDCTPQQDALKLSSLKTGNVEHLWKTGKKKGNKGGNSSSVGSTGNQISGQRKVSAKANSAVCKQGLEGLNMYLKTTGSFISVKHHTSIQETMLRLGLTLGNLNPSPPYSDPACRMGLYRLVTTCVTHPHHHWPAPTPAALTLLTQGLTDSAPQVTSVCRECIQVCETILHPIAPSVCVPLNSEDILPLPLKNTPQGEPKSSAFSAQIADYNKSSPQVWVETCVKDSAKPKPEKNSPLSFQEAFLNSSIINRGTAEGSEIESLDSESVIHTESGDEEESVADNSISAVGEDKEIPVVSQNVDSSPVLEDGEKSPKGKILPKDKDIEEVVVEEDDEGKEKDEEDECVIEMVEAPTKPSSSKSANNHRMRSADVEITGVEGQVNSPKRKFVNGQQNSNGMRGKAKQAKLAKAADNDSTVSTKADDVGLMLECFVDAAPDT